MAAKGKASSKIAPGFSIPTESFDSKCAPAPFKCRKSGREINEKTKR